MAPDFQYIIDPRFFLNKNKLTGLFGTLVHWPFILGELEAWNEVNKNGNGSECYRKRRITDQEPYLTGIYYIHLRTNIQAYKPFE